MEANLRYWHRQEQAGGNFWTALLRRVRAVQQQIGVVQRLLA